MTYVLGQIVLCNAKKTQVVYWSEITRYFQKSESVSKSKFCFDWFKMERKLFSDIKIAFGGNFLITIFEK